jgi:hypothetical protein
VLLAGRIIAAPGFAAGALSIAVVREHRSGPGLSRSFGVIAAFEGAAAGVGFTLGGTIEQAARSDWRPVFLAVAAVAALTGVLAAATIPGSARASRGVDVPGAVLLAGGLVAALLPITDGATWGWTSWQVTGLLAGAVVLLAGWAAVELTRPGPLVRLSLLALPGVAGGTALFLVTSATVGVVNLTVPSFLQAPPGAGYGAAASALGAGLDLLPFAVAITAAGFAVGRLARRMPPRLLAAAALGCEALALGLLAGFHHTAAQVVILVAVFGLGHGGTLAAEYVLLTGAVPAQAAGASAGLASAVSGVSGAVASAVTTALLAGGAVHAGTAALPAPGGYERSWLCAAAVAAAGAVTAAVSAYRARAGTRECEPADSGVSRRS